MHIKSKLSGRFRLEDRGQQVIDFQGQSGSLLIDNTSVRRSLNSRNSSIIIKLLKLNRFGAETSSKQPLKKRARKPEKKLTKKQSSAVFGPVTEPLLNPVPGGSFQVDGGHDLNYSWGVDNTGSFGSVTEPFLKPVPGGSFDKVDGGHGFNDSGELAKLLDLN
tara:strand:- start:271 stop:759 length:489 start_codon:yes stop_codon:yes gene_type:complete